MARCVCSAREGVCVVVKADGGRGALSLSPAGASAAPAALDPHDVTRDVLSVWAEEPQTHRSGSGRLTASAIHTHATHTRPEAAGRGAAGKRDRLWFPRPHCPSTLLSSLNDISNRKPLMRVLIPTCEGIICNNGYKNMFDLSLKSPVVDHFSS
ncbi:hypothetical protein R3I94_014041 [Phoxinus phoxinus]